MKKTLSLSVFLLFLFKSFALQKMEKLDLVKEQSQKLADAIRTESLTEIPAIFLDEAALLPEYHKSLWGKSNISAYYGQFFDSTQTLKFNKESFEILKLDGYYVELGTFQHTYKTPLGKDFGYNGKYLTYWKFSEKNTPKILAHIWGASKYFEAENLNFVTVATKCKEKLTPKSKWENDIEKMRQFAYDAVFAGDARTQLTTYADDATYMTYYDPPFIGKEQISGYFHSHYNPDVPMDSLMTKSVKIIEMGEHALKFGEYRVEWTWEGQPSYIEGKGLTLFRRGLDGSVKIFRQMINHSMPASPK